MRELKFRAWIKPLKRYAMGYESVSYHQQCNMEHSWWVNVSPEEDYYGEDVIIEQYTGLKDKNGKEIYEGDIVKRVRKTPKNKSTIYQVVWDTFLTGFDLKNLDCSKTDIGYLNEFAMEEDYEVIGNVHENKELLDVQ